MSVLRFFIARASLLALVLGVALSGLGMAQVHTAMMMDVPAVTPDAQIADHSLHSMHAMGDHVDHSMAAAEHGGAHDGHSNCPMIACCHTGGTYSFDVSALAEPVIFKYLSTANSQLGKAEPENAKKPPKHV